MQLTRSGADQIANALILWPKGGSSVAQATSLFSPHPNLGDDVNHNLVQSEIEGGVFLKDLPSATVLQIETQLLLHSSACGRGLGSDFRTSGVLSTTRSGGDRWLDLGRFHAETAVCRSRYASGVSSSGVSNTHCHLSYQRDPRVRTAEPAGSRGTRVGPVKDSDIPILKEPTRSA